MAVRILLCATVFSVFCGVMSLMDVPRDGQEFKEYLKSMGKKPGPLGYFNSAYMAFTSEEADEFPNLVSFRTKMRKMKTYNATLYSASLILQHDKLVKADRNRFKRDSSFPVTTPSGSCESTIGGLERLCEVCPHVTDLGPDKIPRYINEVLCGEEESCSVSDVVGLCQNSKVVQDFLMIVGSSMVIYTQEIRVCCECALFP